MALKRHVVVARTHHVLAWLGFVATLLILLTIFSSKEVPVEAFLLAAVTGGMGLVHRHVSNAAMLKQAWARTTSIVIAVLILFGFPLGTLVGFYLLYHTRQPWNEDGQQT